MQRRNLKYQLLHAAALISILSVCICVSSCRKDGAVGEQSSSKTTPIDRNKFAGEDTSIEAVVSEVTTESQELPEDPNWPRPRSNERIADRKKMLETIHTWYELKDEKVLEAMGNVPRHWFVPERLQNLAYTDRPLPIGHDQTISQPYIVAYMTSQLKLNENKKVLEIGTGSGYQAAVLNELTPHVYSIEIIESLAKTAEKALRLHGYKTINLRIGDGYKGWPEVQPFDAIIVTCAPDHVPPDLVEQLKAEGRIIIPIGDVYGVQSLTIITKDSEGKFKKESVMPVRFVPMLRESED